MAPDFGDTGGCPRGAAPSICSAAGNAGEVELRVPGRHNVLNALAAAALTPAAGVRPSRDVAGLSSFAGLRRRLEMLGHGRRRDACRRLRPSPDRDGGGPGRRCGGCSPGRRVWCVFQPHQASRTARLLDELAASLQNADRVMVAEIFRARGGIPEPGEVDGGRPGPPGAALGDGKCPAPHPRRNRRVLETQLGPRRRIGHAWGRATSEGLVMDLERFREDRASG